MNGDISLLMGQSVRVRTSAAERWFVGVITAIDPGPGASAVRVTDTHGDSRYGADFEVELLHEPDQAAVLAVQQVLGCEKVSWVGEYVCFRHEGTWTETGCPEAVAAVAAVKQALGP